MLNLISCANLSVTTTWISSVGSFFRLVISALSAIMRLVVERMSSATPGIIVNGMYQGILCMIKTEEFYAKNFFVAGVLAFSNDGEKAVELPFRFILEWVISPQEDQ